GAIQPERYVVWGGIPSPSICTIAWGLYPMDASHTRLVSRVQFRLKLNQPTTVPLLVTEFFDHLAVRKAMLGIKGRVEGHVEPFAIQALELIFCLIGMAEFATAVILILVVRKWRRAWITALFAGFGFLFILYGHPAIWMSAVLECILLAGLVWALGFVPYRVSKVTGVLNEQKG
ncbi:MAG TPA: hypothetical protein VN203_08560, partial [Candidatus Acidoferrum sp.]|nr:hypothetical protein [Candidatus Acidoferrum sp.]